MPKIKTVVEVTDFRGGNMQFELEVWQESVYPGKLKYLGTLLMQGQEGLSAEGNEEEGHFSYYEEGISCWTRWETKEIEIFSYEEKERMMMEDYLDDLEDEQSKPPNWENSMEALHKTLSQPYNDPEGK
jgi:hypothetical protein